MLAFKLLCSLGKDLRFDDRGDIHLHPVRRRAKRAGLGAGAAEPVFADIGLVTEDFGDELLGEGGPAPRLEPKPAELSCNSRDADRPFPAIAGDVKREDELHDLGFCRVDLQLLLLLLAPGLGDVSPVAQWRLAPVPEALTGILQHGAGGVLGGLPALVLIEHPDHGPHHRSGLGITEVLADRDELDARFLQGAFVDQEVGQGSRKAGLRMNDDDVEGARCALRGP
nr:hypothetical protein [Parvularcula mediterranea]